MAKKGDVEPDGSDEQYAGDEGGEAGAGEEYDTEGLPGGRIPNPPPRDPWVSRVVDDPSNPPDAVLLSGYVGDAAEEGRSRIYTDASLSSYVEVSDEDVLHHEPGRGDAVPEGGSLVWVRSDALVTPGPSGGTGSGGATGGDFFTGPVLAQNRKPGTGTGTGAGEAIGPVQITLLTIAGCFTQRFGCTIFTCPTRNFLCRTVHPIICSHVCQQGGGIGIPGGGGGLGGFEPVDTYSCPPSVGCFEKGAPVAQPRMGQAQGEPVGPTGWFHCGELIGQTGWQECGQQHQVSLPGCIQTGTCEGTDTVQAAGGTVIGRTGWQGCGQPTHLIGCTGYQGCGQPHISLPGCIHTGTCSALDACPTRLCGGRQGTDTVQAAGTPIHLPDSEWVDARGAQAAGGQAAAAPTGQYAPECPTFGFTCTYVHCPPQSAATVCTQIGCQTQQCTFPPRCEPPTSPNNTLATVCTQINCPSFGFTCTVFCQAQGGGADTVQAAAAPTGQYAPQCPTFGFTCTYVHCPPQSVATVCTQLGCQTQQCTLPPGCPPPTGPNNTLATVCTQINCPSFGFTCTAFCQAERGGADTVQGAGMAGPGIAAATVRTQIGCPTFGFTCTAFCQAQGAGGGGGGGGAQGAAPGAATAATACTQFGCVPRTRACPPTFQPGCGPDHEHGGSTAATLCTLTPFCPPTAHCPGHTLATLCTQIGCQPHTGLGCPRTSSCPPTQTPGCGGGGILPSYGQWCAGGGGVRAEAPAAEGAAAPTTVYGPQCPTFGFTCTYVHCPPPPVTAGLGCPTSTCPPHTLAFGCPPTSTCPPVTVGLGCPPTSTCPPQSLPFGCPVSATCPPPTGVCPPA
jgi:hypothetical protein